MLFEVTKQDSKQISYLFGTMHTASENAYTFYPQALEALSLVHTFAAEIDLSDPELDSMSSLFLLPDNLSIRDFLSEKKYNKINHQLKKSFNFDLNDYDRMQPLFLINQILVRTIPAVKPEALDHQLFKDALSMSKSIVGLESMQDQRDIVGKLDMETQFIQLKKVAKRPNRARDKMKAMDNLYANGDIKAIYHFGRRSLGKYRPVLLTNRNKRMVQSMDNFMSNHTLFAAVGAAHLYGNNGMIKLLKNAGYRVKKKT